MTILSNRSYDIFKCDSCENTTENSFDWITVTTIKAGNSMSKDYTWPSQDFCANCANIMAQAVKLHKIGSFK